MNGDGSTYRAGLRILAALCEPFYGGPYYNRSLHGAFSPIGCIYIILDSSRSTSEMLHGRLHFSLFEIDCAMQLFARDYLIIGSHCIVRQIS
jgi:hypothetical protein